MCFLQSAGRSFKITKNVFRPSGPLLPVALRGPGGLHENFSEIDFLVFLIEEIDIYQMFLVPKKNIGPSRIYRQSKVSAYNV